MRVLYLLGALNRRISKINTDKAITNGLTGLKLGLFLLKKTLKRSKKSGVGFVLYSCIIC